MVRGLYNSGWSMIAGNRKMDVIANNLANSATTGFKKDAVIFESFPDLLTKRLGDTKTNSNLSGVVGTMNYSSDVSQIYTVFSQGQLVDTGNRLDFGLADSDRTFFVVGVPDSNGKIVSHYTRNGAFHLNQNGLLVTADGFPVLGKNGTLITLKGDKIAVDETGTITQNGKIAGQLALAQINDTATLRKIGDNLLAATEETGFENPEGHVKQGYLEQSNVNVIKEMVDMITVTRQYEANQKVLQIIDSTLDRAVNEVGSAR